MERPNYDRCDDRLKAKIDHQTKVMLTNIWTMVFHELDRTDLRYSLYGEDAGLLAQKCVDAISHELPEYLAR